jgi:hypothetical protein
MTLAGDGSFVPTKRRCKCADLTIKLSQSQKQQVIMKKQFNIKPAQLVKVITQAAAKVESTNVLRLLMDDTSPCCSEWDLSRMVVINR